MKKHYQIYATGINSDNEFFLNNKFEEIVDKISGLKLKSENNAIKLAIDLSSEYKDIVFVLLCQNKKFQNQCYMLLSYMYTLCHQGLQYQKHKL